MTATTDTTVLLVVLGLLAITYIGIGVLRHLRPPAWGVEIREKDCETWYFADVWFHSEQPARRYAQRVNEGAYTNVEARVVKLD